MQKTIHKNNIPCHPERSEGSHSLIRKLPHWLIFSFLFISLSGYAQNYQWDWGLTGGGSTGEIGWNYQAEQIFDIAIDSNNNYYFLAKIKNGSPQLNGQPVIVYGNLQGGNDIFLFSTTSSGTVRWSQTIGGGGLIDEAYKIALHSNNIVYVGTTLSVANANKTVHFTPTEARPGTADTPSTLSGYFKTTFLVKYDTNGQFVWKRALQGDVNNYNSDSTILDILIDSN